MAYSLETSSVKTINGEVSGLADVVARQAIANLPTLSGGEGIQIVNEDGKNRIDLGLSAGSNMSFVYDQETNTIRLDAGGGVEEVNLTMTYTAGTYTGLDYDTISSTIANNPGKKININLVTDYDNYGSISRDIDKFTLTNSSYYYSFATNGTYNYYFTQAPSLNTNSSFNAKTIIASANTSNKGVRVLTGAFTGYKINMDYDVYTKTHTVTAINNSPISASSAGVALVAISALNGGGGSGLNWTTDGTTYSGLIQDGTFNNNYRHLIFGRYDTDKAGVSVSSMVDTGAGFFVNNTNLYLGGISNSSYRHRDVITKTYSDFNISSVQFKDVITNPGIDTITQTTYDRNGLHFSGYKYIELNSSAYDNSAINLTFADIDYLQNNSASLGKTYTGVAPIQVNNSTNEISISGEELSAGPGIALFESGGYVVISAEGGNAFPITGTNGTTGFTANMDCSSMMLTTGASPAGGYVKQTVRGVQYEAYPATDMSASWYNIINATNNRSNCYCIRFTNDMTAADLANYSAYDKVTVVHSNEYTPDCMLYWDGNTKVFPSGLYCELVKGTNDNNQVDWFFTNSGWTNNLWWDWD